MKEKIKKINLKKYGFDSHNKNFEIKEKKKRSCLIKYGVENPQQNIDFYISELNLIIEIKSDYTYNKDKEKNLLKQKSCIDQGYDFIFIINKNYTELNEKIKE